MTRTAIAVPHVEPQRLLPVIASLAVAVVT
jgi:hypothetical protein